MRRSKRRKPRKPAQTEVSIAFSCIPPAGTTPARGAGCGIPTNKGLVEEQLTQFEEQRDWLCEEVQFAVAMAGGIAKEQRLRELTQRCGQLGRELRKFMGRCSRR